MSILESDWRKLRAVEAEDAVEREGLVAEAIGASATPRTARSGLLRRTVRRFS
jgi:hypothetical protein